MRIKMLSSETINKIAAGEVIVRPVSVIKELVENAIDAGAKRITVTVEGGGKDRMVVSDDGCGIPYNEVPLAFERHATSKLLTIDDLEDVETLGFRGEALSSIMAVSKVCVTTRFLEEEVGSQTTFEGGALINQRVCGHDRGTVLAVSDLFYNVPARRKHLGKAQAEAMAILDVMEKLALSHPEIAFTTIIEGKRQFATTGSGRLQDAIEGTLGRGFFSGLVPLDEENTPMGLTGYIGDLSATRSTRDLQIIFINGRYVKNKGLMAAFEAAYEGYVMQHRHPVGIIFMTLPGRMLDVNIHPAKTEIAILNQSLVHLLFKQGIRDALHRQNLAIDLSASEEGPSLETISGEEVSGDLPSETRDVSLGKVEAESIEEQQRLIPKKPSVFIEAVEKVFESPYEEGVEHDQVAEATPAFSPSPADPGKEDVASIQRRVDFSNARVVGQLFFTFILLEQGEEAILIDQHAAHEAFMYEELSKRFKRAETFPAQTMLVPQSIPVEPRVTANFETLVEPLRRYGFDCDVFGEDALMVRSVPIILGEAQEPPLVTAFLDAALYDTEAQRDDQIKRIITMSCKAAVKGNQTLGINEIKSLLTKLEGLENPFTCPHGRPIIFKVRRYELEKLFKRVV
ncbi:DNA mismatch repair endonuclease MutL [Eubacterium barkeri]|uniref:DNA mismatch repair protein MutL n=1 Tax=Eubacterium barkeri TaxID=1528 RepID=A0A1H3ID35_EUBBA|nr:DNA mismatch repair endonuclease MutL [Eubacterium barkeri]SDY25169.1 DNA mismatch repair protein MutL [Eubacterium barkeri]